jgi:hypothetical protein
MWVTQTYLGTVEPDAKLFIYYFFEDYRSEQTNFTESVQAELEKLGELFGDKVSLLMPNPRYAGHIEAEVRENRPLWESLKGELPGLFLSRVPLVRIDREADTCVYIPFPTRDSASVAKIIHRIRRIAGDTLSWDFANQQPPKRVSFAGRLRNAVEIKPGIWGFSIDLKALFTNK